MHKFCCSIYCCSCSTLLLHTTFQAIQTLMVGILAVYFFVTGGLDGGGRFLCQDHIGIFVSLFSLSPIFILQLLQTFKLYQILSQLSGNESTSAIKANMRILFYLKMMFVAILLLLAWVLANASRLDPLYIVSYVAVDLMIYVISGAATLLRIGQVNWESSEDEESVSATEDEDQLLAVINLDDEKDGGGVINGGKVGNIAVVFTV